MMGQVRGVSTDSPFQVDTRGNGTEHFTLVVFWRQSEVTQNNVLYIALTGLAGCLVANPPHNVSSPPAKETRTGRLGVSVLIRLQPRPVARFDPVYAGPTGIKLQVGSPWKVSPNFRLTPVGAPALITVKRATLVVALQPTNQEAS